MSAREMLYCVLAVAAAVLGWYYNLQYMQQPGAGWIDWIRQCMVNPASASALMDLTLIYLIVDIWMVVEARRIGLRWAAYVFVPATVFVSLGFGVGLFLLFRERHLRKPPLVVG
jgi:hypothetical protein